MPMSTHSYSWRYFLVLHLSIFIENFVTNLTQYFAKYLSSMFSDNIFVLALVMLLSFRPTIKSHSKILLVPQTTKSGVHFAHDKSSPSILDHASQCADLRHF